MTRQATSHNPESWGASTAGISAGGSVALEAFGELQIPLIKDRPFFKDLALSAAGRITSVEQKGHRSDSATADIGNFTYKLGGDWAVNELAPFPRHLLEPHSARRRCSSR